MGNVKKNAVESKPAGTEKPAAPFDQQIGNYVTIAERLVRVISMLVILSIAAYISLFPNNVYSPVPRNILFLLISVFLALLFSSELSQSVLKLQGKSFLFVTFGGTAVCITMLMVLNFYSKPEQQIAVFQIFDESLKPVPLNLVERLKIPETLQGVRVTHYIDDNNLVLIFPEQVPEIKVQIQLTKEQPIYFVPLGYAGNRISEVVLNKNQQQLGKETQVTP